MAKNNISAKLLACGLAAVLMCGGCKKQEEVPPLQKYDGELGSAKELDGVTVVVTIFASDYNTGWNREDGETAEKMQTSLEYLGKGLDYITEESRKWGKNAEFVYDWNEDEELMFLRNIPLEYGMNPYEGPYRMIMAIENTIDSAALMEKYSADNIVYNCVFNTPKDNEFSSYAYPKGSYSDTAPFEFSFISYTSEKGDISGPVVYAHEILHLFGAYDYYEGRAFEAITDEFHDYLSVTEPYEIMLNTRNPETDSYEYDDISCVISEATAYYVGWTDSCDLIEKYGCAVSEHIKPAVTE